MIERDIRRRPRTGFQYRDKGMMATIGRGRAVAHGRGLPELTGFLAWLAWGVVHIFYLIGFHNRVIVIFEWLWSFITFGRGERLVTAPVQGRVRWKGSVRPLTPSFDTPSETERAAAQFRQRHE